MGRRNKKKKVYWVLGLPGLMRWWEADMAMMLSRHTRHEYVRWRCEPVKVVRLRPMMIAKFMEATKKPTDTLVFLDIDHAHPPHIVNSLVARDDLAIHTSLTFKRAPQMPTALAMDYNDGWDRSPEMVSGLNQGDILEVDRGGFGAVAVQRQVFSAILDLGYGIHNMFEYHGTADCDKHFAMLCQEAGYKQHVNTGLVSPHMTDIPSSITLEMWDKWAKDKGQPGVVSAA